MHIGLELKNIDVNFFDDFHHYLSIGKLAVNNHKRKIQSTLDKFKNYNGNLDGDKMQSNWFPQINADIFLSHSHADENLVIALAGWLKQIFNLEVFVDSCIWGYSKNLQKIIDEKYSKNLQGNLDYKKVLYASSHVHMMLNTALMQMIDNCECIIFLNTPNSVKPREVIDQVVSPWIYSEIGMTKLVRKKSLRSHRTKYLNESKVFSQLEIEYNLNTDHLIKLTLNNLIRWQKNYNEENRSTSINNYIEGQPNNFNKNHNKNALDSLYKIKESEMS